MIIECPHCESKVDCKEVGSVDFDTEDYGLPAKAVLVACAVCKNPLLGVSEIVQVSMDNWDWGELQRLWPKSESSVDAEIPEIVRVSLVEAKTCFKAKAYSACAVMCGRAIEGLCKHHNTKSRNLAGGLKELKVSGIIDKRIFDWGEALREHRNLGAHASTEKVSNDDADDLLNFCTAICEYVFVLNAKFERFQNRRKKT